LIIAVSTAGRNADRRRAIRNRCIPECDRDQPMQLRRAGGAASRTTCESALNLALVPVSSLPPSPLPQLAALPDLQLESPD
jgi:hypothetical protein